MKKRIVSMLLVLAMVLSMVPLAASATTPETVYISVSDDAQYVLDANGEAVAYAAVPLDELATINLDDYGLGEYWYDADGDGQCEITALHLYIYTHEVLLGLDFSNVYITGGAGSLYFASDLFGFCDENLRYDYNGAYPAIDGWGLTADQIVLSDGDYLNVAHYTSWAFWGDSVTGFHYFADGEGNITHDYTAAAEEGCTVKLVRSYSDWTNGGGTALADEPYFEVFYGTSYGNAVGSATTDDYGCAEITFPSAGTWYVWSDGGYGMENPSDIVSAPAFAKVTVEATEQPEPEQTEPEQTEPALEPADPIDVYVTLANAGEVVMAQEKVTVTDLNVNGIINVDEALYAAHEASYTGGAAAGYATTVTPYGLGITKLWGDESGNYGYWLNDGSCWSLDDTVSAGDHLVAFVYQNTEVWDSYAKFIQKDYTVMAETGLTVTLEKAGYDGNWNTVFSRHSGADIKVLNSELQEMFAESYTVTDNSDGTYTVKIKNIGSCYVVAYDNTTPIVPAVSSVTVTENPDIAYADEVEAKIDQIGTVTVFSGSKINAAKTAYDGLTEEQKALVENAALLTAAEDALEQLYVLAAQADHQTIYTQTNAYIVALGTPGVGSVGGEWMVIDLTRAGEPCPDGYYENVVAYVEEKSTIRSSCTEQSLQTTPA